MLGRGAAWGCCSQSSLAVYGALTLSGRAEFSQHCCSLRMSFLTKGLLLHYYWGELKLHFAGLVLIKMCTFSFPRERERKSSAGHTGSCSSVSWTQPPPRWHGNHSWYKCVCVCAHKGFLGLHLVPNCPVSLGCRAQVTVGITVGVRLLWTPGSGWCPSAWGG